MKRTKLSRSALAVLALWAASTAPSLAHGYLVDSFPAAKTHLVRSPHKIWLVFSLKVDPQYSTVQLRAEDGSVG